MSDEWLAGVKNRVQLFQGFAARQPSAIIVEVGVEYGLFSQEIAEACPSATLYAVDPWRYQTEGYQDPCNKPQEELDEVYRQCCERLAPYGERVKVLRMTGHEASRQLAEQRFDVVYIDGNHSYNAVKADIRDWWPLVRPGGVLAGHDYTENPNKHVVGVIPAVTEFCAAQRLKAYLLNTTGDCSWAIRKPQ